MVKTWFFHCRGSEVSFWWWNKILQAKRGRALKKKVRFWKHVTFLIGKLLYKTKAAPELSSLNMKTDLKSRSWLGQSLGLSIAKTTMGAINIYFVPQLFLKERKVSLLCPLGILLLFSWQMNTLAPNCWGMTLYHGAGEGGQAALIKPSLGWWLPRFVYCQDSWKYSIKIWIIYECDIQLGKTKTSLGK